MCEAAARGAAVAALVVAHNLGLLLMYAAADARLAHRYSPRTALCSAASTARRCRR